ncbi:cyclase family protein [Deinococcus roseus]|uniref:Cyclase n=1 Tax=Deinococcus roseus TaxID=392414 RepID=A0ABQ2DI51_9DEIO|nr:cyclase family protein [Deinococcus roseus]GGJ58446.1 hypothetical protein GCM10008938_50660 [Deinococcus roseus]
MQPIDLSAPLQNTPADVPAFQRIHIEYRTNQQGADDIEQMFQVPRELLHQQEGWATDTIRELGTHSTTHIDAPRHYNSSIQGQDSQTIDELPLEWFFQPGICLNFQHKEDGEAITLHDLQQALQGINHTLSPLEIVLIHTGRDQFYGQGDYWLRGPGVTAEATRYLFEQGIRVMGIDSWGWDRPLHLQARDAQEHQKGGIFWAAHQLDLPYAQIERLVNLSSLPPKGFMVSCFPLRLVGGSAAPARVVALL